MQKTVKVSIFLIIGLLLVGLGVFARQFGLDPNPGWGKGRIALVILGLIVALIPWLIKKRSISAQRVTQTDLFAFPALLIVIGMYFWFVTVSHDATSNYYSLLATSFRNGELSLPLDPDPALLALPNPYDPATRQGIKVPVDLSLYNGKFYLYWGPAPSALLAVVQRFVPGRLGEVDLLFLFMCGILLAQYLLILHIWERFFPRIPRWTLVLSIFLAGLANPVLWMLSQPKIYEAAIAGAQFFFIAGFASAVLALDRRAASGWGLALAGALWALAVGTRTVALFAVVFMIVMIIYWLLKTRGGSIFRVMGNLVALGLPLLIGALGFGWYNWARFGSFAETGFTYQLAAPYLQEHMNELFLPGYIVQNLYNYLVNPVIIKPEFPFLSPIRGRLEELFIGQSLPEFYTAQAVTGFLYAVPFVVFAVIPIVCLVRRLLRGERGREPIQDTNTLSLGWITASLAGSFALPFLSLLAFFWAAMRYAEDFMPALIVLSIIGFWQGYEFLSEGSGKGKIYASLGVTLAALSILNGILLALSIYYSSGLL
jgi:hypothetical protein